MVLTNEQLDNLLNSLLSYTSGRDMLLLDYYTTMYNTGARPEELADVSLWSQIDDETIRLRALKGNNPRTFDAGLFSITFINRLIKGLELFPACRPSTSRLWFNRYFKFARVYIGNKESSLYLFRHNRFKLYRDSGLTDDECLAKSGETKIDTFNVYYYSLPTV